MSVYFAGDTGIFSDMGLINELYRPQYVILPIGGLTTMGPDDAASSVMKYFSFAHTVIPMSYETTEDFPGPGKFEEFRVKLVEWL